MKQRWMKKMVSAVCAAALISVPLSALGEEPEEQGTRTVGSLIEVKEWISEPGTDHSDSAADPSEPVSQERSEDSLRIQNAPEFDTQEAASYIENLPVIRELAKTIQDDEGLVVFGSAAPSDEALNELQAQIDRLSQDQHTVSLIMVDLNTLSGVACHSSAAMCSQSTIKGVYLGSLLEERPELLTEHWQEFHDAIVYSDNEAYESLRETYGNECLLRWCQEAGVSENFAELLYPRENSARDMFLMWTVLYRYLNGGTCDPDFASWFADSLASAAALQLGNRYPVQTKAGWETGYYEDILDPDDFVPDRYVDGNPLNDEIAANDTGVVYTEEGPYLFVIYTDHFYDFYDNVVLAHPLCGLEEALCNVKLSM